MSADEELAAEIAGMLVRIENNYQRETSGPGSRFEGRTLEAVQAEAVIRRIFERIGNEHYVIFTEDGWTTEHSIECRLSGHMHECAYHEAIGRMEGESYPSAIGRWRITDIGEGALELERAEVPS